MRARFAKAVGWLLGMGLLVASTAWADGAECNMECTAKADAVLQRCMSSCPTQGDPMKPGPMRSCALRCQERQEERFADCDKRCAKPEGVESPRKSKSRGGGGEPRQR
ncbi:hypothetical protein LZ198_09160 [Myxococcus sp. K15C18031901]|uniref:hypothetical protein n=1 Tax=Myxococcus dinghuensis TaxID=2906761 RepID=UPI0020A7A932|nr:hypothetical protein [Myxococcus dinghuensis]MCP3099041.1 hypothetical protein [Myxococcus dinghuensis]